VQQEHPVTAILGRTLRSEWIKLRSVRSTYLIVGVAAVLGVGVGLVYLSSVVRGWDTATAADRAAFDPVGDSFGGFQLIQLGFGALGVLAISTEYSTGTIRASFAATPRRGRVYLAKALVLGALALIVCDACAFASFLLGQAVLSAGGLNVHLGDPGVLRAVTGAGLYLTVVTMIGFGLGAIIRHTAGAMTVLFGLVFLAWPVARAVEGFSTLPDRWLLVNAADALVTTQPLTGPQAVRVPSAGMAYAELAVYLIVLLGLGAWRVSRDA
jgi:ABC-type transport system involved in multi-copper enzyme maturation permease subunit